MEFLPIKPSVLNALVWVALVLIVLGFNAGIGTAEGARYLMGGVFLGFPAYFANILWIEGFARGHH
ncbi:hypothetical protein LZ24_00229 [Desulfobotulus alkaliphilus]|uniref:Uncharacterized protein n=1 Tax=Desulfobotulus alkaliphilus TaxID=622671 RepID=A0A562S7L2_9BACT|nr:hypothetical protein [Desulfobotulus alkaliphilus]TWI77419.1 hypothetical protein LZ24_00229 [Desulfobotulus alkaliphilus]